MTELTDTEIRVLLEALDDEYKSFSTYSQVIDDFGPVRPFTRIREAEGRHIDALLGLFQRYGLDVPENPWPGRVERYALLQAACEAGVVGEIANGEMYERLLQATRRDDILTVLGNLQAASQERHLRAFRRCMQRHAQGGNVANDAGCSQPSAEGPGGGRRRRRRGGQSGQ